ncbi:two-component system, cell cycle sensor histidine kinase PleC [uncultured Gammaproteobacteria bacterium]
MSLLVTNVIDQRLAELLRAWRTATAAPLPALAELVAAPHLNAAFAPWLDNLIVVARDGQSFRYDHYGEVFRRRFEIDLTGQVLGHQPESLLPADCRLILHTEYAYVADKQCPLWRSHVVETKNGNEIWQRLILPLGPNKLLAAVYHQPESPQVAADGAVAYAELLRMVIAAVPLWLNADGTIAGLAIKLADLTEAWLREELITASQQRAEDASRAKSLFLATMSHELRTPLNAILGFSEMIKTETFGLISERKYVEYAENIHISGHHLLELVNDVLDLAKIEAGRLSIEPGWLDAVHVVHAITRLLREQAEANGLRLRLDVPRPPPPLWADERAIKQILFNLLSNAIKFTPNGGWVTVSCRPDENGAVALAVADTGRGIAPDQIDRVLHPFEQIDNRYGRSAGGTGLGLALVKGLAELHGGTIRLDSTVGVGTTVTVLFPPPPAVDGIPDDDETGDGG